MEWNGFGAYGAVSAYGALGPNFARTFDAPSKQLKEIRAPNHPWEPWQSDRRAWLN